MVDNDGWSRFFHLQTTLVGQQCLQWDRPVIDIGYFIIALQTCVCVCAMVEIWYMVCSHPFHMGNPHSGCVHSCKFCEWNVLLTILQYWYTIPSSDGPIAWQRAHAFKAPSISNSKDHQLSGNRISSKPSLHETMVFLSKIWPSTSCTLSKYHMVHFY